MLDKLFNLKGLGVSVAVGMLIGSGSALWLSGAAKAKQEKKDAIAALEAERGSHQDTMRLMEMKDELVQVLNIQSTRDKEYIESLQSANVEMATRLPRDTVRYIERGQEIADEIVLQGGNECLRYVVPERLRVYANGGDIEPEVPLAASF